MHPKVYFFLLLICTLSFSQNPVINEVLSANTNVNADEDGDYSDWVELYNPGSQPVSLAGAGLSDDPGQPYKWVFPNITMPGGSYLLVWCSDKDRTNPEMPLHTNFKISASGETITLTGAGFGDSVSVPAIADNVSFGRVPNGTGAFLQLSQVTPEASNPATGSLGVLPAPVFSHSGGYYAQPFNLSITSPDPQAQILYTLDGSKPDPQNLSGKTYNYKNSYEELAGQPTGEMLTQFIQTLVYAEPFEVVDRSPLPNKIAQISSTQHFAPVYFPQGPIFKATIVRAIAVREGYTQSPVTSATFIVNPLGTGVFSFPLLVSLSMDEDALFDYEDGIYVAGTDFDTWRADNPTVNTTPYNFDANFHRKGDTSERQAHIDMFDNGLEIVNQDIGVRLSGDSSRAWPSKSFQLIAREELGAGDFEHHFFDDVPTSTFRRLLLRNSGNDFRRTMYRDALAQSLVSDLLETQAYRPAIALLNGEYWGILNLRERYDRFYFENVHEIPIGELDMLENDLTPEEGDGYHYAAMQQFLEANSLESQDNFDYIATQLDPDDFRDYYITNIYLSNADWPGWNTLFWRKRTPAFQPNAPKAHDGRWRTALKDTDSAFGLTVNTNSHNTLAHATEPDGPSYPNPPQSTLVLRSLLENDGFKTNFINRFADLLNTYFLPERVIALSTGMKNTLQPEILDHIDRWKAVEYVWWNIHIDNIHVYAQQRPGYQRQHIREKFGIDGEVNATLDVSDPAHGYVHINTIDILPTTPGVAANPYPWSGIYFNGIPVTLRAVARPGYVFSHWEGTVSGNLEEITFTPTGDFSATAVFVEDPAPQIEQPIYFWAFDSALANDLPLETIGSTYHLTAAPAVIRFESSLAGYPFNASHPDWRKASMERRNNPTELNYIGSANQGLSFAQADIKGLQIKQPFATADGENALILEMPLSAFEDPRLSFAVVDEGAADGVDIAYRIQPEGEWQTLQSGVPLTGDYTVVEADFSAAEGVDGNPAFEVRLSFTGDDMQADQGNRVTLNNIALHATPISLDIEQLQAPQWAIYPNPTSGILNIRGIEASTFKLFASDGRLVMSGVSSEQLDLHHLEKGLYVLQVETPQGRFQKKVARR